MDQYRHTDEMEGFILQIGLAIFIIRRQLTGRSKRNPGKLDAEEILKAKKEKREPTHYSTFSPAII